MNSFKNIISEINRIKDIALPTGIAAVAKYVGIEDARKIDESSLKKTIKRDFAIVSNIVDAAEISFFFIQSVSTIYQHWNALTSKQKTAIAGVFALGIVGGIYSCTQFGHEQTSFTAGGVASLSCSFFYTAEKLAEKYGTPLSDEKNNNDFSNSSHYVNIFAHEFTS